MIRHHSPGDPAVAVARLAQRVDTLATDIAGLKRLYTDVEAHTRTLADFTDLLRSLTNNIDGAASGPAAAGDPANGDGLSESPFDEQPAHTHACVAPDWLTVTDPTLAIGWLDALAVWVRRVWTRYAPIQPCWPWHPPVVAELLVTHHQWLAATGHGAGPDLLAVWHDRWRPGVAARTSRWLQACERADSHIGAGSTRWRTDPAYLDEYAHWWTTTNPHPDTPDNAGTVDAGSGMVPAPGLIRDTTW